MHRLIQIPQPNLAPHLAVTLLVAVGQLFLLQSAYAQTASGTNILNQASATYFDEEGVEQDVVSNQVRTLIRQVGGIDLVASQSKPGVPNGQVLFPHVLTNTGNGPDSYEICIGNESGDYSFDSIQVFPDEDEDGLPDSFTEIEDADFDGCYDIGPLAASESASFVVAVRTPDLVAADQNSQFDITAVSDFDLSLSALNTDDVTLIDGPLIEVVKSLSAYRGYAGTGGYSVTIEYRNVGTEDATDLFITDILPLLASDGSTGDTSRGMIYTGGTAEWQQGTAINLLGSSIDPLTDADPADIQADAGTSVIYCAYDASCTTLPFGADQATIQVDLVPVGDIGSFTFNFSVDDGYDAGSILKNVANFEYDNAAGSVTFGSYSSNTVNFVITDEVDTPGVVANDSDSDITLGVDDSLDSNNIVSIASVAQGESARFSNYIWNDSVAGVDTFDIELDLLNDREGNPLGAAAFPAGTSFSLFREDGRTPLQDSNGNGIPDTGPIASGAFVEVVVRADLPANVVGDNPSNGNNGWEVTKIATSISDATVSNAVTDALLAVDSGSVDLTNNAAGDEGSGLGPEVAPVNTIVISPGENGVFQLWLENTGTQPDTYQLSFSDQAPFSEGSLPAGWNVTFLIDGGGLDCVTTGAEVSSGVVVIPGFPNRKLVCAIVEIPNSEPPVLAQDLYFRARSDSTGSQDIKRDAVTVPEAPALTIETDMTGQTEPGSSVIYQHNITNVGNQPLECVNINVNQSLAAEGWTAAVYLDVDNSGTLSGGDTILTDQTLPIGDSFRIVIRVFAPTTAVYGIIDNLDVEVEGYPVGSGCATGILTDAVIDRTTTSNTDMVINKNQGPDLDCNGIIDGALSNDAPSAPFSLASFTVLPGQCVVYRLVATNQGVEPLFNALVQDVVPSFTTYLAAAQQCAVQDATACSFVSAPADGATLAEVSAISAEVSPSGTLTVFFGIRVE